MQNEGLNKLSIMILFETERFLKDPFKNKTILHIDPDGQKILAESKRLKQLGYIHYKTDPAVTTLTPSGILLIGVLRDLSKKGYFN